MKDFKKVEDGKVRMLWLTNFEEGDDTLGKNLFQEYEGSAKNNLYWIKIDLRNMDETLERTRFKHTLQEDEENTGETLTLEKIED